MFSPVKHEYCSVVCLFTMPRIADPFSIFSLCRAKKVVQLPDYHFVDHRIEIMSHDKDYNNVKLCEHAEAHSGLPRQAK